MTDFIIAIVVALVAALPGILAFFNQRRKNDDDAEDRFQRRVLAYTNRLEERVDKLERALKNKDTEIADLQRLYNERGTELLQLRKENVELRAEVERLKRMIEEMQRRRTTRKRPSSPNESVGASAKEIKDGR